MKKNDLIPLLLFSIFSLMITGAIGASNFDEVNRTINVLISPSPVSCTSPPTAWTLQDPGEDFVNTPFYDVYFVNTKVGWAVGENGTIIKTTDGGLNWVAQTSGVTAVLHGVHFIDANIGYVVGTPNNDGLETILKTTDGGGTWINEAIATNSTAYNDVDITPSGQGAAVGASGSQGALTQIKNSNPFDYKRPIPANSNITLRSVDFVEVSGGSSLAHGWAVGDGGIIVNTTTGGATWNTQTSGTSFILFGVSFADKDNGWAVGLSGTIRNTSNGGTQWNSQTSGTSALLFGVDFVDASTGWSVGTKGTIINTTNGGTNWNSQVSGTSEDLSSVHFVDQYNGWAVGEKGTILKYGVVCNGDSPLPTATGMYQSAFAVEDENGWTHYCDQCGELLLAVQKGTTGVDIADNAVELEIGANTVTYYPNGTGFITNSGGAVLFNRTWDVNATSQPNNDLPIRYFFTNAEYNAVNTELTAQSQTPLTNPNQLSFYKTTVDGNTPVANLTTANTTVLTFGTASTTEWALANRMDGNYYAEYLVTSLSGGGGGGADNGSTILPVELLSFEGQIIGNQVQLNWQTTSETNNEGFYVERSENGKMWKSLGFVKGAGATVAQQNYSFVDQQTQSGVRYYRLKQMDFDGTYAYSSIISLYKEEKKHALQVYPNPLQGGLLQIAIPTNVSGQSVQLEVFNQLGQLVATQSSPMTSNLGIDLRHLPSGIYALVLSAGNQRWTEQVVVEQ